MQHHVLQHSLSSIYQRIYGRLQQQDQSSEEDRIRIPQFQQFPTTDPDDKLFVLTPERSEPTALQGSTFRITL